MTKKLTHFWRQIAGAVERRVRTARGRVSDAGYSVVEWVVITAVGATLIGLVYAAVNSKVLEKIGIIKGV